MKQAASLGETASAMEQLTATVQLNASNAEQASELARGASSLAAHGRDAVGSKIGTMRAIHTDSAQMTGIISTIESIAFQTNILALNAAVEAARAGDEVAASRSSPARCAASRNARPRPRPRARLAR
ncbi:methyl-accepting chemotaxis protein [Paraburkholderia sp. CI3]